MQTFMVGGSADPLHNCLETMEHLDRARLGKQRVEAQQIWSALTTGRGWIHHPATKMWAGHPEAVSAYGFFACKEWIRRGHHDMMMNRFYEQSMLRDRDAKGGFTALKWPWWFANPSMVLSHRSNLIRKDSTLYGGVWPSVPDYIPYIWPSAEVPGQFRLSRAEYNRGGFQLPAGWSVDPTNLVVTIRDPLEDMLDA